MCVIFDVLFARWCCCHCNEARHQKRRKKQETYTNKTPCAHFSVFDQCSSHILNACVRASLPCSAQGKCAKQGELKSKKVIYMRLRLQFSTMYALRSELIIFCYCCILYDYIVCTVFSSRTTDSNYTLIN